MIALYYVKQPMFVLKLMHSTRVLNTLPKSPSYNGGQVYSLQRTALPLPLDDDAE